jgi:uncharacterized protein
MSFISKGKKKLFLSVKITPNSSENKILGISNDTLKIKIKAPPDKGKANLELIKFLSKLLKISKSSIEIVKGKTSSMKIIAISSESPDIQDILLQKK